MRSSLRWLVCALGVSLACRPGPGAEKARPQAVVELIPINSTAKRTALHRIDPADYRRAMAQTRLEREGTIYAAQLPTELEAALLDQLIEQRLLLLTAHEMGISASTTAVAGELSAMKEAMPKGDFEKSLVATYQTEADVVQSIRERLITTALLENEVVATATVTRADLQTAWDSLSADERTRRPRVRAAQIVVQTEEAAKKIARSLRRKKAEFDELARTQSIAPEAVQGGDLGWFEKGVMPKVFDEVCFSLAPNQISGVVPSQYGFHIFKVIEVEPERPLTFAEAAPRLTRGLLHERVTTMRAVYVDKLSSQYRIVKHLPLEPTESSP